MSDASKRKERQKWEIEKPRPDNARRSRGIFFIDLDDEEYEDIMKNARKKLEIPMPAAMLCRTRREEYMETCRVEDNYDTKNACIVEANESSYCREKN